MNNPTKLLTFSDCKALTLKPRAGVDNNMLNAIIRACLRNNLVIDNVYYLIKSILNLDQPERSELDVLAHYYNIDIDWFMYNVNDLIYKIIRNPYVYTLENSKTDFVFYVGSGQHSRLMDHVHELLSNIELQNRKLADVLMTFDDPIDNVYYRLAEYGCRTRENAYKLENDLINSYGIENLVNTRQAYNDNSHGENVRGDIRIIIANFVIFCSFIEQKQQLKPRERIILQGLFLKAFYNSSIRYVPASIRELAEICAMTVNPVQKSLKKLIDADLIKRIVKGRGGYSSRYSFNEDIIRYFLTSITLTPCSSFTNHSNTGNMCHLEYTLGHDAFRQRALNNTGYLVYQYVTSTPGELFSKKQLSELLNVSYSSIVNAVNKMVQCNMLNKSGSKFFFSGTCDLESCAMFYGTQGTRERAIEQHRTERMFEIEHFIFETARKIDYKYSHMSAGPILLSYVIDEYLKLSETSCYILNQ